MKFIQEIKIMASDFLTTIESIAAQIAAHPKNGIDEAEVKTILQDGLAPIQQRLADLEQGTTDLAKAEAGSADTTGAGTLPGGTNTTGDTNA